MIDVRCGACNQDFSVADDFAGHSEKCPACGALNDVPDEAPEHTAGGGESSTMLMLLEAPRVHTIERATSKPMHKRGIPAALWWGIVLAAVTAFTVGICVLSRDDWEQANLLSLVGLSVSGDHLMDSGDFQGAAGKYENILTQVGTRRLASEYLIELVKTVRVRFNQARTDAEITTRVQTADAMAAAHQWDTAVADYNDALISAPKKIDPSDPIGPVLQRARKGLAVAQDPAVRRGDDPTIPLDHSALSETARPAPATQNDTEVHGISAVKRFQRDSEDFAKYVSSKAFLFADADGKWRQRQFVVWDVSTVRGPDSTPISPQLKLVYSATARTTGPHIQPNDAENDSNFNVAEQDTFIHHETNFELVGDKWIAHLRRRGDGDTWLDATDPQFALKRADGSIERYLEQDLWQLENQIMAK